MTTEDFMRFDDRTPLAGTALSADEEAAFMRGWNAREEEMLKQHGALLEHAGSVAETIHHFADKEIADVVAATIRKLIAILARTGAA